MHISQSSYGPGNLRKNKGWSKFANCLVGLRESEKGYLPFLDHEKCSFISPIVYGVGSFSMPLIANESDRTDQSISSSLFLLFISRYSTKSNTSALRGQAVLEDVEQFVLSKSFYLTSFTASKDYHYFWEITSTERQNQPALQAIGWIGWLHCLINKYYDALSTIFFPILMLLRHSKQYYSR